jgi:hypothetical protein
MQFYFLKYCLLPAVTQIDPTPDIIVFDPVFTLEEQEQIHHLGGKVLNDLIPQANKLNFYFMPHCERFLYLNVCE